MDEEYLSRSDKRYQERASKYLERKAEQGKTIDNDDDVKAMFELYASEGDRKLMKEKTPNWKINNLEYDLRSTMWILEKARASEVYSLDLYCALCNNQFAKLKRDESDRIIQVLSDDYEPWSCTWRYAGGIVADMREEGDYMEWYCRGIGRDDGVGEGGVTEEIEQDLKKLGWIVITDW